jgi:hypothetical protein
MTINVGVGQHAQRYYDRDGFRRTRLEVDAGDRTEHGRSAPA